MWRCQTVLGCQTRFLDAHPAVAAVGGAVIEIDTSGRHGGASYFATGNRGIRSTLMRRNCIAHPTVLVRRSALAAVGGYRLQYAEDYDLWLRLSERFELANLARPLTLYRRHLGQYSLATASQQARGALAAVAAAKVRRAGQVDPLGDDGEVTDALLVEFDIAPEKVAQHVESACIEWAATLAGLDYLAESAALLAGVRAAHRERAARAIRSARQLRLAGARASARRPLSAGYHIVDALRLSPGYASRRIVNCLRDRLRGRRIAGRI